MRTFASVDGHHWGVRIADGAGEHRVDPAAVGWEAILFELSEPEDRQRLTYRPVGWFDAATDQELESALAESEIVRTRWGTQPQQAGG